MSGRPPRTRHLCTLKPVGRDQSWCSRGGKIYRCGRSQVEHLEEGGAEVEGQGHDPDHLKKERVGDRLKSLSLLLVSPRCKSYFKKERGHGAQALLP